MLVKSDSKRQKLSHGHLFKWGDYIWGWGKSVYYYKQRWPGNWAFDFSIRWLADHQGFNLYLETPTGAREYNLLDNLHCNNRPSWGFQRLLEKVTSIKVKKEDMVVVTEQNFGWDLFRILNLVFYIQQGRDPGEHNYGRSFGISILGFFYHRHSYRHSLAYYQEILKEE